MCVRTPSGATEQPNDQQTDDRRTPISEGDAKWRELLNGHYVVLKFCFSHPIPAKAYWSKIILFLKPVSGQRLFFTKKSPAYSPTYNLVLNLARRIPNGGRCWVANKESCNCVSHTRFRSKLVGVIFFPNPFPVKDYF